MTIAFTEGKLVSKTTCSLCAIEHYVDDNSSVNAGKMVWCLVSEHSVTNLRDSLLFEPAFSGFFKNQIKIITTRHTSQLCNNVWRH